MYTLKIYVGDKVLSSEHLHFVDAADRLQWASGVHHINFAEIISTNGDRYTWDSSMDLWEEVTTV
jgi:hypothetical protein